MKLVSKAAERVGKHLQHDFVLNSMMFDGELKADKIAEAARSKGFQDEWLTGLVKKKKPSDGGKKQACLTETLSFTLDQVRKHVSSVVCMWQGCRVCLCMLCC